MVNFAGIQDKVTLYTDLIKVGVALDNGQIVFYDARGYITNHRKRELEAPKISAEQAAKSVSKNLMITSSKLALIPSMGLNELLTYEFRTKAPDGKNVLVYVNAITGAEEKILILLETETGVLTK
ncbi:MAG TPA: hypothetical protein DCP97_04605 [Ruminococcaceae bacterium]|nr:hypothetical protein [Oscillospiraceae bacterium]